VRGVGGKSILLVGALVVALAVAGAGVAAHYSGQHSNAGSTLIFGTGADPAFLDGAVISDAESSRVLNQITETLVTLKPGTTKVIPLLATRWTSKGGKVWTFYLRHGVKFHDGTPFNAKAVCFNFNRWYNFSGAFQDPDATYYWQAVFGGFHHNESSDLSPSIFRSCRTRGNYIAVVTLTKPYGPVLPALTLTSFGIASPAAMKKYGANQAAIKNGTFELTGSYGFSHPTGTGPYKFKSWTIGQSLEIDRNPNYWGKKPKISRIIFRPVGDSTARLQALQSGELQGMDYLAPQDTSTVRGSGKYTVLTRPQVDLGYVTINTAQAPTDKVLVRKAIAYGLDRKGVVNAFYGGRGVVASQFQPPSLFGYAKNVTKYSYNPDKAKALLRQAGLSLPVKIDFWYPTNVTRPYMPNPKGIFEAFSASLEKSGFQVVPHSAPWRPDYLKKVDDGSAGNLNLVGWIPDYGDPDDWLGVWFKTYSAQFGFHDNHLFNLLQKAASVPNINVRTKLYQQANRYIMGTLVPGVPYVYTGSALALDKPVKGYIASPTQTEFFNLVRIGGR
jgi:peptide/nickel transport system substrate-binding protein